MIDEKSVDEILIMLGSFDINLVSRNFPVFYFQNQISIIKFNFELMEVKYEGYNLTRGELVGNLIKEIKLSFLGRAKENIFEKFYDSKFYFK